MSGTGMPRILGIDHVHIYVADRVRAEKWYAEILGYRRVSGLEVWATSTGPLTLENSEGNVHLALFQSDSERPSNVLAFGVIGTEFVRWLTHFRGTGTEVQVKDHELSMSMYFEDPDQNVLEITTYDAETVRIELGL